tara:strand:- start:27 stop:638 length:612 start_codon:yes stop_codon:yes gene_type:complete
MARNKNELPDLAKEVNRYTATVINKGVLPIAEEVVKELQFKGPSWTGLYSNSWQIEISGKKSTGTRRPGEPKPVKAPKLDVKSIRSGRSSRDTVELRITNLARSRVYAQDEREGRFRRGKVGNKIIGSEPKTSLGKSKFEQSGSGRTGVTKRGAIGGGNPGVLSGRTAPLDWFKTYKDGGFLQQTIKLELNKSIKKARGKKLK